MKILYILLAALLAESSAIYATPSLAHEDENGPFWVHGRISPWNGTPTFRIWVVGTKRILGVTDQDSESIPKSFLDLFLSQTSVFGTKVYADFYVEPLKPDKKGFMRPIRLLKAKKIVVTYDDKVVLKKDKL